MKNKLFYILILFNIICPVSAQEPAICGDWVGDFTDMVLVDRSEIKVASTRTIRITYKDGGYDVKMKTIRKDNNEIYYHTGAQITYSNDNSISWHYLLAIDDDYWDSSEKCNGIIVGSSKIYRCCNVELAEGVLIYTMHLRRLYYDRNGNYIGEWNGANIDNDVMKKEEENW